MTWSTAFMANQESLRQISTSCPVLPQSLIHGSDLFGIEEKRLGQLPLWHVTEVLAKLEQT